MSIIDTIKYGTPTQRFEAIKNYKHWDSHETAYAGFMHRHDEPEWISWTGKVLLTGILLDIPVKDIIDYLFESFHGLSLGEIPLEWEDLEEDMANYKENSHED